MLTLENKEPQGHSRAVFDLRQEGSYTFHMDVSQDGRQWQTFMEGNYRRGR